MALLNSFLKQTCVWRRPEGYGPTGTPIYLYDEEIPCRWVRNARRFLDAAGNARETTVDVYTLSEVEIGAQLERDGMTVTVRTVKDYVEVGGQDGGRRVGCS